MLALQSLLKISCSCCNGNLIWPLLQSMQCAQNKAWIQKSFTNIILKLHIVHRNPKPPLLRPMRMRLENWRCLANQPLFITRICSRIKYLLHNLLYLILTTTVYSRWDRPTSVFIDFVFLLPRLTQPPISLSSLLKLYSAADTVIHKSHTTTANEDGRFFYKQKSLIGSRANNTKVHS